MSIESLGIMASRGETVEGGMICGPVGEKRRWTLDDFEIGNRLGHGKFGCVYVEKKSFVFVIFILSSDD